VTSNDTIINPPLVEGQSNPSRRDTITIPPTGNVVLRWRADNPGAWFFHCHIDWHLSSMSKPQMMPSGSSSKLNPVLSLGGLAAVFVEAPEKFQENTTIPQVIYDQCKLWDRPTSGNVVGHDSTTDFKGEPWGPFPLVMVNPSSPCPSSPSFSSLYLSFSACANLPP
jgi:iron transport multicopper oxidase